MNVATMGRGFLSDFFNREWTVDVEEETAEILCVRVRRGFGQDIEYGSARVPLRCILQQSRPEDMLQVLLATGKEAIRQAEYYAWVKAKRGKLIGIAGIWRKWAT